MGVYSVRDELKFQQFAESHPKILIIDDEDGFRKVLKEMFSTIGCEVYSAKNGKVGLDIYKEPSTFDLVILNMPMSIMDGRVFFRKIRKINPEQKILIMSGYLNLDDLDKTMKRDAIGFIKKPFSVYKIIGKVKDIIYN
jgi:two-component system response regulator (stage 0 sporulation protein F)